jgi:hypothetical protein
MEAEDGRWTLKMDAEDGRLKLMVRKLVLNASAVTRDGRPTGHDMMNRGKESM